MGQKAIDVLIIGAGPTGLTLACELARSGLSFRIIEKSAASQAGSRGKGIQPRSLEVFDNLGMIDTVLSHGQMGMPICSVDAAGKEAWSGLEGGEPRPDIPYPSTLVIPQWRIEEALRNHLLSHGGEVEFGVELVSFDQSLDSVDTEVVTGDGESETIRSRWLVGCDGGHSIVRKHAGFEFLGETIDDIRMIVADVRAEGVERSCWRMWRHEEGFAALCPLPSTDQFQYQASIVPSQDGELSIDNMQAILETRTRRTDIRLKDVGWRSLWRANVRMVDRYRSGRVLLAGDAAHIHSPAGGQGMNTGIQDAHNLGWKLVSVIRGASILLLNTYEEERLPVAAGVLSLSNDLLRQAIKDRGIAVKRDERTNQLSVGYRGSSLSREEGAQRALLRAGDRAPDASGLRTTSGERRLFELLRGEHFTLLCFGVHQEIDELVLKHNWLRLRAVNVVAELAMPEDVVDTAGSLHAAYAPDATPFYVIRPDGYIGLIADRISAVDTWFEAAFQSKSR